MPQTFLAAVASSQFVRASPFLPIAGRHVHPDGVHVALRKHAVLPGHHGRRGHHGVETRVLQAVPGRRLRHGLRLLLHGGGAAGVGAGQFEVVDVLVVSMLLLNIPAQFVFLFMVL